MLKEKRATLAAFFAMALMALMLGIVGLAAPMPAYADDAYEMKLDGVFYGGETPVYGTPGEKLGTTITATVGTRDEETWEFTEVEGANYKWTAASALKVTVDGNKLTINKLPKIAGTYKVTVKAKKGGVLLAKKTFKVVVKKQPKLVLSTSVIPGQPSVSTFTLDDTVRLLMKNASWGWDNNVTKNFYKLTVTNVSTGEVAVFKNKKDAFAKNTFVSGFSVAGDTEPWVFMDFKQAGKYKIEVTLFHSDKKLITKSKGIGVSAS